MSVHEGKHERSWEKQLKTPISRWLMSPTYRRSSWGRWRSRRRRRGRRRRRRRRWRRRRRLWMTWAKISEKSLWFRTLARSSSLFKTKQFITIIVIIAILIRLPPLKAERGTLCQLETSRREVSDWCRSKACSGNTEQIQEILKKYWENLRNIALILHKYWSAKCQTYVAQGMH